MPDTQAAQGPDYCLTICGPAAVGEKVLDVLMEVIDAPFEIGPVFTHGAAHGRMQPDELVSGRAQAVQAQLLVSAAQLDKLLARFREELSGAGIRYWATPVALQGEIE